MFTKKKIIWMPSALQVKVFVRQPVDVSPFTSVIVPPSVPTVCGRFA
jgi:hypothetical protein